jgi:hypothetical protein
MEIGIMVGLMVLITVVIIGAICITIDRGADREDNINR